MTGDTDWRPDLTAWNHNRDPLKEELVPCPAHRCGSDNVGICGLCGSAGQVTRRMAEEYEAERSGPSKLVDADFDQLEQRYFSQLARTNPQMAEEMKLLVEKHCPPKLVRKDVKGLCELMHRSGAPAYQIELVNRMIKELGLDK